jgi:hypothetical protein
MWVKISKPEDTKKLKVGDKVRVDGTEYKCTRTYRPADYGFDVDGELPHGNDVMSSTRVKRFEHTIELWEEEETTMNKQYKIKLKEGDACKIEGLTEEQYHQVCKRFIDSGAGTDYYAWGYASNKGREYACWYMSNLCHVDNLKGLRATIYTYEQIMEEESQMLERDKEYDIKLTGEQLAIVLLLTGCTNDYRSKEEIFQKIDNMFPKKRKYMQTGWINSLNCNKDQIDEWITSLFTKPETEQEKKIREMEEQYTALGKAIEEAKKGSK